MYKLNTAPFAASLLLAVLRIQAVFGAVGDDQYALATRHYSLQRWQLAVQEFETFLKESPDHRHADEAVFLLGESLVQLQRFEEAGTRFGEFLQRAPQHRFATQARFRAGETAFLTGDNQAAQTALREFHQRHPQDPLNAYALAYLGQILLDASDGPGAEAVYNEVLRQFKQGPLDVECRFGIAQAFELQGKLNEALRFYQFLAENHHGPRADDAQLRSGVLYYKTGQYDLAVAALSAIDTSFPDSDVFVDSLYWLGTTRLAQGNASAAVTTLRKAHRAAPRHELADAILFSLAEATRQSGDLESAEAYYEQLQESSPDSQWADDAAQILVTLAFDRGDHETVHQRAAAFVAKYPTSSLVGSVLQTDGRALLKEGRYAAAVEKLEHLLGETSADSRTQLASVSQNADEHRATYYYLGLAYLGAQRHGAALDILQRVDPQDQTLKQGVAVARAFALVAQKQYGAAIEPLRSYLEARPDGPDAADCRAKLIVSLAETGSLKEAAQTHSAFERSNHDHALFLPTTEYLAQTAYANGDVALASRLYKILSQQENPPEFIAKGLSGIGKLQMSAGDARQSATTFAQLIEQAPQSTHAAEAALLRGTLLQSQEQHDAALATFHLVIDQYPASPQAPFALLGAARLHAQLKQNREALPLLEQLVARYPQFTQRDAAIYQLAWVRNDLNQVEQAEAAFEQLLTEHRGSAFWADAAYRLAERAAQAGQHPRATELLDQLLAGKTEAEIRSHALYLKGQVAANQQQWPEVIPSMRRILDESGDSPLRIPAEYWIAEAQYRLGKYDEAETILSRLVVETQHDGAAWLAMIPLRRAQVFAQREEWARASEIATGIAERFPNFRQQYEVDYLIGRCLTSQARLSEARQAYERVIRSPTGGRTETAAMAQWMIGETYFHQKEFDQAIRAYHRVEGLYAYPRWQAAALLQAGKCHELKSETTLAIGLYAQLLKQYPETTYAEDASRRLQVAQQRPAAETAR